MTSNSNSLTELKQLGQSIWLDFIQRSLMSSGELQQLIERDGICGITSNPSIFENAIAKTNEYDSSLQQALSQQPTASELDLFNALAIADIAAAADIFLPTYQESQGDEGMVSLEVSPELAHDADATVEEALYLHQQLNRPNVMIKVPGTVAGVDAFRRLTEAGINVNVTLLFSVERYKAIANAYIEGLQARAAKGHSLKGITSVASFFISRVDTAVDNALEAEGSAAAKALLGQIAIANAKIAYGHYLNLFKGKQFAAFAEQGALPQRLLWASTGTKNPAYSDTYYVEELLGAETVNTLPPATLDAFRDHGTAAAKLPLSLEAAHQQVEALASLGIDLNGITQTLEHDGIVSFQEAFQRLLDVIASKRDTLN